MAAPTPLPAVSAPRAGRWAGLVLAAVIVAAYLPGVRAPFLFDDTLSIAENPTIRRLWPLSGPLRPPDGGLTVSGRPLLNLSLAFNHAISGASPWSYRVFNILLHAANALLVMGIVRRTILRCPAGRPAAGRAQSLAWSAGAVWALNPIQTQAVTYAVQRAESLMACCYLFTLYAFIRGVEETGPRDAPRRGWFHASIVACFLGMGTKEVMVTAPLMVLLYDRTFVAGRLADALKARGGYYLGLAAAWVLLAGLVAGAGNRGGTAGLGVGLPLWAYPLTQFEAVARYLALGLWPNPLVFEHGTFWVHRARDLLPFAAVVVPVLGATLWALRRHPVAGFLGAWFFGILAPTSLTPGTIQMIVEHRAYLSLAALATALVLLVHLVAGKRAWLAWLLVALALAALTARRNHDYRSALALWTDTVAKRPHNPRAHEGLAEALTALGRPDHALASRREAVRLDPANARAQFNLALLLAETGRTEEALIHYRESLRHEPNEARTHNNLAIALVRLGRVPEALEHYRAAQRLNPHEPEYLYNHGLALMRLEDRTAALDRFAEALRLQPRAPTLLLALGEAFAGARQFERATESFRLLVERDPRSAAARLRLADGLSDLGRVAEAVPQYEAAIRLEPDRAEAHHNLGVAFARLERWDEARRAFDEALRLRPGYPDAQRSREQLRQVTGR